MKTNKTLKGVNSDTYKELFKERLLTHMQKLIYKRQKSGNTLDVMAELCGVSRSSIVRFENYQAIDPFLVFCYTNILKQLI